MDNTNFIGKFYSVKEFAKLLGISEQTVRRSIKCGRLQAVRIGSGKRASFRIAENELVRLSELDLMKLIDSLVDAKLKT